MAPGEPARAATAPASADTDIGRIQGYWNGNNITEIRFSSGDDTTNMDDGRLHFMTSPDGSSPTERMTIAPNGNVGIGILSPATTLHVAGPGPTVMRVENTATGAPRVSLLGRRAFADTDIGRIISYWNGNSVAEIRMSSGDDTSNTDDGRIHFMTSEDASTVQTRMTILPSGNVGIGTGGPTARLHVIGGGGFNAALFDAGTPLVLRSAGGTEAGRFLAISAPSLAYRPGSSGDHIFQTSGGAELARLTNGGNVGIGTGRWCTNRNWHATVPTTGASSTDGVGSWAAHVGHRIQHIARELRFDRSPTGCPGSKTIADDRLIPEEGVLDSRVLMVA